MIRDCMAVRQEPEDEDHIDIPVSPDHRMCNKVMIEIYIDLGLVNKP